MLIQNDRRYIIVDAREIPLIDFSQFLENSDTVLYNVDKTKLTVKYSGSSPSYSFTYPTQGPFTLEELLANQLESEWPHGDDDEIITE